MAKSEWKRLRLLLIILAVITAVAVGLALTGSYFSDHADPDNTQDYSYFFNNGNFDNNSSDTDTRANSNQTNSNNTDKEGDEEEEANTATGYGSDVGWYLYENAAHKYQIDYHSGSTIEFAPDDIAQAAGFNDGKVCATIEADGVYITIFAGQNEEDKFMLCGHSGVWADYVPISEEIKIDGKVYQSEGFKFDADAAGNYEDFSVVFPYPAGGKYKIEYGVYKYNPNQEGETILDRRERLKKMVESFKVM